MMGLSAGYGKAGKIKRERERNGATIITTFRRVDLKERIERRKSAPGFCIIEINFFIF